MFLHHTLRKRPKPEKNQAKEMSHTQRWMKTRKIHDRYLSRLSLGFSDTSSHDHLNETIDTLQMSKKIA